MSSAVSAPPPGARAAFLTGLLDDAGLFPPARLPLVEAVGRHRRDLERRGWLLGRFLCPAPQLRQLRSLAPAAWHLGAVAPAGQWPRALRDTVEVVGAAAAAGQRVDVVEARLPGENVALEIVTAADALDLLPEGVAAFLEIPLDQDWEETVATGISAVSGAPGAIGVKVRCGGETAEAFPSVEALAAVVARCFDLGVALKATAGLHHPVRRPDPETGATMHGFVNLVGAASLLVAEAIDADGLVEVLADEDAGAFELTDAGFAWRGFKAGPDAIERCRARLFTGYGSCSIDEPVDDLIAMGVLA